MTTKTKNDFQAENSKLEEKLCIMEGKYPELSEKYENLQKQFNLESTKRKQTFRCDKCELNFGSLSAYKRHKQTHMENNEKFQCNHCEREFDEEWKLKAHINTHAKFQCN